MSRQAEIYLTDTAVQDLRAFFPDVDQRKRFLESLNDNLSFLPRRFRRCPPGSPFGPAAHVLVVHRHTVIVEVLDEADTLEVWVRHIWPASSQQAGRMVET